MGAVQAPPVGTSGLPGWLHARVIDLAAGHWRAAEAVADHARLDVERLDAGALRHRLERELTAPLRLEDWPPPTRPRAVAGGWIHDEVVDEDREAFEALLATWAGDGPERVARAAQELRWPVTPYRPPPGRSASGRTGDGRWLGVGDGRLDTPGRPARRRSTPTVVDLTSHWAGPLATSLLARAGADVVKIDPEVRPDGFRARPALYRHLNGHKRIVSLDLRRPSDRDEFEGLLSRADLLVESFSRRVLPNLGYDGDRLAGINPALAVLSIRAFPAGTPEAGWLAYGPGVHAASGLAMLDGTPRPAAVAYPDLVAGLAAYARAVHLLAGTDPVPGAREVSLAAAIGPLTTGLDHLEPRSGADRG